MKKYILVLVFIFTCVCIGYTTDENIAENCNCENIEFMGFVPGQTTYEQAELAILIRPDIYTNVRFYAGYWINPENINSNGQPYKYNRNDINYDNDGRLRTIRYNTSSNSGYIDLRFIDNILYNIFISSVSTTIIDLLNQQYGTYDISFDRRDDGTISFINLDWCGHDISLIYTFSSNNTLALLLFNYHYHPLLSIALDYEQQLKNQFLASRNNQ